MANFKKILQFSLLGLLVSAVISNCSPGMPSPSPTDFSPTNTPGQQMTSTPQPSAPLTSTPTNTLSYVEIMPRSWNYYLNYPWEHDGYPFASENLTVYSDDADAATKAQFAQEAETALERILTELEIDSFDFHVPIDTPEIEIYISSRHNDDVDWEGFAHFGGFLLVYNEKYYRQQMTQAPYQFPYTYLVTHEMTHTVAARIIGDRQYPSRLLPKWFDEGLATYMGIPPIQIRSLNYYDMALKNLDTSFGIYFYCLCELRIHYLIETYGVENTVGILFDMRMLNLTFDEAFENRTGMSTEYFEENYDSLIREFLAGE